ncbi:hypothetical protein OWV82_023657 [Melia azedarach]|uniref:Uncharacterized protein n=1 Tax=Melia azedarach TaxID=155640 RepID=A0ACC1WYJ7_MELAZ|nr:hypothetical protein OWV82_023657 [Melia azedarach]
MKLGIALEMWKESPERLTLMLNNSDGGGLDQEASDVKMETEGINRSGESSDVGTGIEEGNGKHLVVLGGVDCGKQKKHGDVLELNVQVSIFFCSQ